jgi:sodium-dependent dicarboxylate transporter 2/3/5
MKLFMKFASGPAAFLILYALPLAGISPEAKLAGAVFGWMLLWWMLQPLPWGVTSVLPLVLFPMLRLMNINQAVGIYAETIFFWIWGTVLMGYALDKRGLARRFALWFMSLPAVGGNSNRLAFAFMLVTCLVSTVVSDAATVAMMMPVGISVVLFAKKVLKIPATAKSNFGAFLALAALYGAEAGGTATIAGIPHNKLSVDLLEELTGRTLGWFEWMKVGVPITIVTLIMFYFILRYFFPPEFREIPGGEEFLHQEKEKLGPLNRGEKATLFVFAVMVALFTIPTVFQFIFGPTHPITRWGDVGLSLNVVPPLLIVLLLATPVNWEEAEFVLDWKDALVNSPWDIMLLCASATGMVGVLVDFGLAESLGNVVQNLGLGVHSLPFVSAAIVALSTNIMSGTAATTFFGSILIPAAQQIGWNPASMAVLIPNVALGVAMPWAGAAAGTAFATGEIEMKAMIRIGFIATASFVVTRAIIHILMAPYL